MARQSHILGSRLLEDGVAGLDQAALHNQIVELRLESQINIVGRERLVVAESSTAR